MYKAKYTPKITINPDAKPNHFGHVFFGGFLLMAALALPIPFFRHTLTFSSVVVAGFAAVGCKLAYDDLKKGAVRIKPPTWGESTIPKWWKHWGFWLIMIGVTAGLRLGFYIVPVAWIVSWVAIHSMIKHIEATFKKEEVTDGKDSNS